MKTISQGIFIRSNLKAGMGGDSISSSEKCKNKCISERDVRTLDCFFAGWPQADTDRNYYYCVGERNGDELNRCLATCPA